MLEKQGTWKLVPRISIGKTKLVRCKYVFKNKRIKDGETIFKSRLVACGYSQVAGESFSLDELYASVVAHSSIRFLLSYGCQNGMLISQADITSAYLQSKLDDEVYMVPRPDMWENGKPPVDELGNELCLKLERGLCGLKQSGFCGRKLSRNLFSATRWVLWKQRGTATCTSRSFDYSRRPRRGNYSRTIR